MKKTLTVILGVLVCAVIVTAIYRIAFRKHIPEAPVAEQVAAILEQNDCYVCHVPNPELPLYATFPMMGEKMKEHCQHAVQFFDMSNKDLEHPDAVTLSMLEHCIQYGTMPLSEYKMIHWGTGFNKEENSVLAAWIMGNRDQSEAIPAIPTVVEADWAKVALGERMFNDARISLDGTITCATCHVLETGGADHADERVSEGINGLRGGVNAPTVYNAGYYVRQFWNGRAADLREQAEGPATNPVEMGDQTWDQIVARLRQDKALVAEFEALYPGEGLTKMSVTGAIAEFEKTLITPNCRFDQYLKGREEALTADELAGYELFKKNCCAACHTGVAMGGQSFEQLCIYGDYFADRDTAIAYNGDDNGLKGFSGKDEDLHKFKVPTLRNIDMTAPYFHDGTIQTLEEAVHAMAKYELGRELSDADVASIVAFMHTLTGESKYFSAK